MKEQPKSREEKVNNLLDVVELYTAGHSPEAILKNFNISRVSGEPPKPEYELVAIKETDCIHSLKCEKCGITYRNTGKTLEVKEVSGEAKTPNTPQELALETLFKIKFVANMHVNDFEGFKLTYATLWHKVILPTLKQISNVE